jgi:flagellar hook-associated protein 1 FlgK
MMMASTFGGLNTVVSGMAAQQLALNTTGHNVSNAGTPGYSRQTVNLVASTPQQIYTGNGLTMLGTGVTTQSITRARDFLVNSQYWQQNATKSFWQTQTDVLSKTENVFNDTTDTGIQNAINLFQTALATLANDPGVSSTRTAAREAANTLVETLKTAGQELTTQANDISSQIDTQIAQVNTYSTQIASLNKQIITQEATGATANDLRDQRDVLVDSLSALTKVNVTEDKAGAYTVIIAGGGVPLVQGDIATKLTVEHTNNTPYGYDTTSVTTSDGTIPVTFKDGSIASLTQLRDTTINGYLGNLDTMAKSLLQDFNAIHNSGKTTNYITDADGDPILDANGKPTLQAGDNFFGVTGTDYTTNPAADPTNPSNPQPASWLSILKVNDALYGTNGLNLIAAAGGSAAGTADGTNATALANWLVTAPSTASVALGSDSFSGYYASCVSAIGVQSQQAQNMNTNQGVIVDAIATTRESVSGVSMDEELANMIKFQQVYGACAKILSTMDSMLDTLVNRTTA